MNRLITLLAAILLTITASAQRNGYRGSYRPSSSPARNTHSRPSRLDYSDGPYVGFRIGPTFSTVSSDDPYLDGGSMKTGLNVGIAAGTPIMFDTPLYLESGLYFTQKGGEGKALGSKFTYDLQYLEVPILLKYKCEIDHNASIQPFIGGYFAVGVGGKIKDFEYRQAYSSFSSSSDAFKRFDSGLKFGCGAEFSPFYIEMAYDLGLTNICHDYFDTSKNGALTLSVGVNF